MRSSRIPGFPHYVVRDDGVVLRDTRHLKPQIRNGYLRVALRTGAERRMFPVHRLVLEAFVGPRSTPRHHGAHLDGNRRNNTVSNLAWKLPEKNEADKRLHGTMRGGGLRQPTPPLRVRAILRRLESGQSYTQISMRFGIHRHTVSRIARGQRRKAIVSRVTTGPC